MADNRNKRHTYIPYAGVLRHIAMHCDALRCIAVYCGATLQQHVESPALLQRRALLPTLLRSLRVTAGAVAGCVCRGQAGRWPPHLLPSDSETGSDSDLTRI